MLKPARIILGNKDAEYTTTLSKKYPDKKTDGMYILLATTPFLTIKEGADFLRDHFEKGAGIQLGKINFKRGTAIAYGQEYVGLGGVLTRNKEKYYMYEVKVVDKDQQLLLTLSL